MLNVMKTNTIFFFFFRHSRAYLHALFKSDTAAMHHVTIHNIAYQVSIGKHLVKLVKLFKFCLEIWSFQYISLYTDQLFNVSKSNFCVESLTKWYSNTDNTSFYIGYKCRVPL